MDLQSIVVNIKDETSANDVSDSYSNIEPERTDKKRDGELEQHKGKGLLRGADQRRNGLELRASPGESLSGNSTSCRIRDQEGHPKWELQRGKSRKLKRQRIQAD